jgi:hypothetical protein
MVQYWIPAIIIGIISIKMKTQFIPVNYKRSLDEVSLITN